MKKIINIICVCLLCCAFLLIGCSASVPTLPDGSDGSVVTPVKPNPDDGEEEKPPVKPDPDDGEEEKPPVKPNPDDGEEEKPPVKPNPDDGEEEKPPVKPNPDDGEEEPPVESKNIEGFDNLALSIAEINIVTDDGEDITGDFKNQEYKQCTVSLTNGRKGEDFSGATGKVRVRGNNTADYPKKSYRIKFDEKINLVGLNGGAKFKNWVLLACYKDVTYLRDAVVFELAKQTLAENGYYSSDYAFAEVSVNGEYNGLYLVAEQQQVNKNRIEINEPADGYTGNDIGWLIEFDGNARMTEEQGHYFKVDYKQSGYRITCEDGTLFYPGQMMGLGFAYYTIKNDFYSDTQADFIKNYTENVFKLIYDAIYKNEYYAFNSDYTELVQAQYDDAQSAIAAAVNLDSMVDTFIIAELACDNDVDWSSFFFTVDMSESGDKKLTFQAPWDFDSGFGMMNGLEEYDKIFSANVSTNAMRALNPWTAVFFSADWFRQAVAERFEELETAGVFDRVIELIDKVTATYEAYFNRNYEKWDNLGKIVDEVQGDTVTTFNTHADAANYLKNWIIHRVQFLSEYFASIRE